MVRFDKERWRVLLDTAGERHTSRPWRRAHAGRVHRRCAARTADHACARRLRQNGVQENQERYYLAPAPVQAGRFDEAGSMLDRVEQLNRRDAATSQDVLRGVALLLDAVAQR
ncbi:MAG TPA: hypothetical protein VMG60_10750 [Burkholderiaceae bacterium]|nr:hypothetical protein [Burkholderiaceae bacterium]